MSFWNNLTGLLGRKPAPYRIPLDPQRVHTLHIGINAYKRSPLKLCVNDVNAVKQRFQEWGVLPQNMVTLLDAEADTQNMKQALHDLVKRANPLDVVIVQYSGHGSQLPCVDETDGKMEILCPVDIHEDFETKNVSDDFIAAIIQNLHQRRVQVYFLPIDCCHTGDLTRSFISDVYNGVRYLPAPDGALYSKRRTFKPREYVENNNVIMLGGCQAHEVSYEYSLAGLGALTWAFLNATEKRGLKPTPRQLHDTVSKKVTGVFKEQHPVLEGKEPLFDVPFFTQFL
jgi:metacaspase-1